MEEQKTSKFYILCPSTIELFVSLNFFASPLKSFISLFDGINFLVKFPLILLGFLKHKLHRLLSIGVHRDEEVLQIHNKHKPPFSYV